MTHHLLLRTAAALFLLLGVGRSTATASPTPGPWTIVTPRDAAPLEALAAREVRRYVFLRTGRLLPLETNDAALAGRANRILVARREARLVETLAADAGLELPPLAAQEYVLKSRDQGGRRVLLLAGGDALGTVYAAYRFAERLGVRFYMHGDVLPDRQVRFDPPALDEVGRPLFALRGIQPFHDFPEGPDWWNTDDYLAVISQLPKLRMNFLGLHCYPEGGVGPEPLVWIGAAEDLRPGGDVAFSYPAQWASTLRDGMWGYKTRKTGEFLFGAAGLFERDGFGPDCMGDWLPSPQSPEACNDVFNRAGAMLRDAFRHARALGVQTCVGTETPLTVPKRVAERLKARGKDPKDLAVVQELYEAMFRRAAQAYAPDYYWFWTPEGWTWEGTKTNEVIATTNDLLAAVAAHRKVQPPFKLATCGWVLGPQQDRALFDQVLPKDVAVSCINREVGKTPVDKGFAQVSGRGKWAIPWLEDDPALTAPQLWAGRMRRDAADARRYGCDGLMGIHWRTRSLGPAVAALAQAAWDQAGWNATPPSPIEEPRVAGPVGGKYAAFPKHAIADTEDDPLYQTVRYNVSAYHLPVPDGAYRVVLKFCEPNYKEAGRRVFDVKLQGKTFIEGLDIFARVGQDRALDFTHENVAVSNGWLDVEFVPVVEYPSIAAIAVSGGGFATNLNCAGPAYRDYAADWPESAPPPQTFPPTDDFYQDWALHEFGPEAAPEAAAVFSSVDGRLPRPADWVHGPGGIRPDHRPWDRVRPEYEFVDRLAALRPKVKGAGQQDRFDYWLRTFEYMRAMARLNCAWAECTNALGKVRAEKDPAAQRSLALETVVPLRRQIVDLLGDVYRHLLATVSNPGELGTVANWEQHLLPDLLAKPAKELADWLKEDLFQDIALPTAYTGPTRVIVPTVRTSFRPGETLALKVMILSEQSPRDAALYSRPMGRGRFTKTPLVHLARGVYLVRFPASATAGDDLEYYVKVVPKAGNPVHFPASAPDLNQTLVAAPTAL